MGKLKNMLGGAFARLKSLFPFGGTLQTPQGSANAPKKPKGHEEQLITAQETVKTPEPPTQIDTTLLPVEPEVAQTQKFNETVEEESDSSSCDEHEPPPSRQYSSSRKRWSFNGKSLTVEEWAQEYGVSRSTMRYRLDKFNSPETPIKGELIEFRGESHTVAEWAKRYGITEATMRYRIAKWHQPELPCDCAQATHTTEPLVKDTSNITILEKEGKIVILKDGVEYTIWQFAKDTGIKFSTLRGRLLKSTDPQKVFAGLKYIGGREHRKCAVQGKIWVFNGEKHTVAEWAEICGTSKATMRVRLNASGNPWQSDVNKSAYNERRTKKYQCEGQQLSIKQLCERYSCSESAMRSRLKKFGSPEPPRPQKDTPTDEQKDAPCEIVSCEGCVDTRDGDESLLTNHELEDELTAEMQEFIRPIKLDFPIDLNKYSEKGHSSTFNSFVREIRKIMTSPDDGMPLSRIIGYGAVD